MEGISLITYTSMVTFQCVQINLSSSAITPLTLPFSEASLLDIRLHNTSINSLWHASSVFLVVHSSPTAFVVHKTRNEYCQATRREDETLFRCIASGGISDITSAKVFKSAWVYYLHCRCCGVAAWCSHIASLTTRFIHLSWTPAILSPPWTRHALSWWHRWLRWRMHFLWKW